MGCSLSCLPPVYSAPTRRLNPPRDAFQPLNPLIGSWKGTGYPDGTREERQKGFWTETIAWEWRFDKADARLTAAFDKGKHFTRWELRYLPEKRSSN